MPTITATPQGWTAIGSLPGAPTGVSAAAGPVSATVSWTAPASDGGRTITGYQVTTTPSIPTSPITVGPTSPAVINGLTAGVSYTFTVAAINIVGTGPASGASNPVIPTSGGSSGGWIYGANGTYKPVAATSGVPAGTVLTLHSGSYTITTAGTTITAMNVTGGIDIKASNVTIASCLVTGASAGSGGSACVDCRWTGCVNALVTDCEIQPAVPTTSFNSSMGHDVTWQRCNIWGGTDGVRSSTNNHDGGNIGTKANVNILGCYIHDLAGWNVDPSQGNGPSHSDPWQPEGGNFNVAIGTNFQGYIGNTLGHGTATWANWNGGNHPVAGSKTTNSCIQFNKNTASQTTGCVVDNNWFGGSYICINVSLGAGNQIDSIRNNQFDHGSTGNLQINLTGTANPTRSGNVFEDGVGSITVHT